MSNGKPKFIRNRADDYKVIFATGFYGGYQPDHFEMIAQTASFNANECQEEGKPVVDIVDNLCIKMTPTQAKSLLDWLANNIKKYEKEFGEIKGKETKQKSEKSTAMYG